MVTLWAAAGTIGLDSTAVALLGLGVLLATGVLTGKHIEKEGDVLATYLWFASLFTLSAQLNELGFMAFLGQLLAGAMSGLGWIWAGLLLLVAYVLLHYLFVSQTAHMLALFGVFLDVGVKLGVPAAPLAFLLLFATNFFSGITSWAGRGWRSSRDDARTTRTRPSTGGPQEVAVMIRKSLFAITTVALLAGVPARPPSAAAQAPATAQKPPAAAALPQVVVLATGGTIAGAAASDVQAGYTSGRWPRCEASRSRTSARRT
jgi:hypothetical protein